MTKTKDFQRPHILVLSDDTDLSAFLSEGLVLGGFWTSVIASGIQAIEVFRLRGFDLVLLDAALGGMGALEVLRRLRGITERDSAARTDIPILVVAANLSEIDPIDAAESGANGTVFPPIELEDLIPTLFRAVGEWRTQHPERPWADVAAQSQ